MSSRESWKTYREASQRFLKDVEDYIDVERKRGKTVRIKSGFECDVDVTAYRVGDEGIVVFECKRWDHLPSQTSLAKFYYSIKKAGVNNEVLINQIDLLQACTIKLAEAEQIIAIKLDFNSTSISYMSDIVSRIFSRVQDEVAMHNVYFLSDKRNQYD